MDEEQAQRSAAIADMAAQRQTITGDQSAPRTYNQQTRPDIEVSRPQAQATQPAKSLPNFGDDSQSGLNRRLEFMQSQNGTVSSQAEGGGVQNFSKQATPPQSIAPGVNFGDDSIAGLNKRIAALQESNGTKPVENNGQGTGLIGKSLSNMAGSALNVVPTSSSAAETAPSMSRQLLSSPNTGNAQAGADSQPQPNNIVPLSGLGTATTTGSFSQGGYKVGETGESGVSKVTSKGASPLYTNIDPAQATQEIAKMKQSPVGPLSAQGYATTAGLESMARANAIRQSMIDSQPQGGMAVLGDPNAQDRENAEKTARWANDALINDIRRMDTRTVAGRAKAQHLATALGQQTDAASRRYGYDTQAQTAAAENQVRMRGQDITARGQDIGLQRSSDRNEVMARGQDLRAGTSADRIASNESIAQARITERSGPSLSQQRGNAEIDAARKRVAGLSPDEIQRRTQQFSATGRENKEFDPSLARDAKLANRRKVGDDNWFDLQQFDKGEDDKRLLRRFLEDKAMQGRKLGKRTPLGIEVLENGRVVGHYN